VAWFDAKGAAMAVTNLGNLLFTNGSGAFLTGLTNGLVGASVTNGLVGASVTNGLVGGSVTNGLIGATITGAMSAYGYTDNAGAGSSIPTNTAGLNVKLNPYTALGSIYTFPAQRCTWQGTVTVTNKSLAVFSNCTVHYAFTIGNIGATNTTLSLPFSWEINPSDKWCITNAQTVGVLVGTNTQTIH